MEMNKEVYLGDGVYAKFDGFHLILSTNKYTEQSDVIYLDTQVRNALRELLAEFVKKEEENDV